MKKQNNIRIRAAVPQDAAEILKIYAYYVENTAITFEYTAPAVEEFAERIRSTLAKYPYIVAEAEGQILGYAYAGPFKQREAYNWSVETSIYMKKDSKGLGVGKKLYNILEEILKKQNVLNLYACIASPIEEDEYLSRESIDFHTYFGYQFIGEFHKCGYKFKRWYNMVWMEKMIGEHQKEQPAFINFNEDLLSGIV